MRNDGRAEMLIMVAKEKANAMLRRGLWPYRVHAVKEEFKYLPKTIDGMKVCETDLVPCAMIEAIDALNNVKFEEIDL